MRCTDESQGASGVMTPVLRVGFLVHAEFFRGSFLRVAFGMWPSNSPDLDLSFVYVQLYFRGSGSECNQVVQELPQFTVVGALRQSGQELFSQHFSGN